MDHTADITRIGHQPGAGNTNAQAKQPETETGQAIPRKTTMKPSKLDPYKEYISELLDKYRQPPVTTQRVLEKIREKGYQGGRTILGEYVASIRGKQAGDPVVYVETAPASGDRTTGASTTFILRTPGLKKR